MVKVGPISSAFDLRQAGQCLAKARISSRCAQHGFTLIEAMIVVAIVGILAAIAGPQFTEMLRNNRASAASSALQVSMNLARSEAIKRGADARVTIAAKDVAGQFQNGWTVFVDKTGIGNGGLAPIADSATVTRLEVVAAPAAGLTFDKSVSANYITYNGQGRTQTPNAGATYWFLQATSEKYCLIVNSSGRVRVARVANAVLCPSS